MELSSNIHDHKYILVKSIMKYFSDFLWVIVVIYSAVMRLLYLVLLF